jgi:7-cyano-7-deazaguanine synthase
VIIEMEKALVLSSGGVDSTTCIGIAVDKFGKENVATVSVFYGQKHSKELQCATNVALHYDLPHYEIDLSGIMKYSNCALLQHSTQDIKHKTYAEQIEEDGKVNTYVPFRNGLMLSSVAALAQSLFPNDEVHIYLGAHADDAAGEAYADCSPEFSKAMYEAINIGTYKMVKVETPLINMNKSEVVKTGLELNVPYELTWSCYEGHEKACGTCGTCIDRLKAFKDNGSVDPIQYK